MKSIMLPVVKKTWVPVSLALTVTLTFFDDHLSFDFGLFFLCLFVAIGHFYVTHFFAAKYFGLFNPSRQIYWNIVSLSYVPFIVSFWIGFWMYEPTEYNFDVSFLTFIVSGIILSFVLFAILILKKVKMDLDVVLALCTIIALVGAATLCLLSWGILKIVDLF